MLQMPLNDEKNKQVLLYMKNTQASVNKIACGLQKKWFCKIFQPSFRQCRHVFSNQSERSHWDLKLYSNKIEQSVLHVLYYALR